MTGKLSVARSRQVARRAIARARRLLRDRCRPLTPGKSVMVSSAGLLRVAGREGQHASRATTLSSLSRTPSRRCCERRSTQDSTALHETAKFSVVQLISGVFCFDRTATTRRMAHWRFRLRPSGGTIQPLTFLRLSFFGKLDLGCKRYAAFVEVGVVTLLFKTLKPLVALFMRNCRRRHCCARSILGLVLRVGDRCRRSSHLLRRTWLGRGRLIRGRSPRWPVRGLDYRGAGLSIRCRL